MGRREYERIAPLFAYPDASFAERVGVVQRFLDDEYPAAGVRLRAFTNTVSNMSRRELEELYTRSFDVQSLTTLDIGYVLFGDDYKRGELLAHLTREHAKAGVDCGSELADHLPNLLCLLARMEDDDLAVELLREILYPSLVNMLAEFDPARVARKNELYEKHYKTLIDAPGCATIYRLALAALADVIETDFPVVTESTPVLGANDFIQILDTELTVESVTSP